VVCLVSSNPLALPELCRLARSSLYRLKTSTLQLALAADVHDTPVPNATAYVLDGFSTGPMTEAVVAGIRARHPRARIIVIIERVAEAQGFALLHLGVKGILKLKELSGSLPKAIQFVAGGGVWMPRGLMGKFLDSTVGRTSALQTSVARRLSPRERQVLDRIVKSLSNKEIANELHISTSTVKFHVAQLFDKFGVRRRSDLILQAVQEPAMLVH
jgi:DNA-binding NarL/FixJ family response regulator